MDFIVTVKHIDFIVAIKTYGFHFTIKHIDFIVAIKTY